jgi:hypothetical protein
MYSYYVNISLSENPVAKLALWEYATEFTGNKQMFPNGTRISV